MACRCGIAKVGISTMFSHTHLYTLYKRTLNSIGWPAVGRPGLLGRWEWKGGVLAQLGGAPPFYALSLSLSLYFSLSLSLSLSDHNSRTGWLPGARIVSAHSGRAGEWKPFYISISICLEGCGMAGCAMAGCTIVVSFLLNTRILSTRSFPVRCAGAFSHFRAVHSAMRTITVLRSAKSQTLTICTDAQDFKSL